MPIASTDPYNIPANVAVIVPHLAFDYTGIVRISAPEDFARDTLIKIANNPETFVHIVVAVSVARDDSDLETQRALLLSTIQEMFDFVPLAPVTPS